MAVIDEILDSLVERSARNVDNYPTERPSPETDLPGKLSLCLEDLLDSAERDLGVARNLAMVQVIEQGVVGWYRSLSDEHRARLGLDGSAIFGDDTPAPRTDQLQLHLSVKDRDDEDLENDDPNPAMAQQQADAYAYQNAAYGYTPMTIHSLGESKNGRGGQGAKGGGSRPNPRKNRPPQSSSDPRKKRNRGRKRG